MIERAPVARDAARPPPEGVFFGGPRPRFGWLHRPAVASGVALVLVPPFGYEAICAHRTLRHLADGAAKAGVLGVQFDLDGTGDSAGDDLDPARLAAWLASVGDACDLARAHGATRIVLAGIRLGATLATLAAANRQDVVGLVAIAAVASGKALVREGRALQMQLGLAAPPAGVTAPPEDVHEQVGFALTAETRAALSAIDLVKAATPARRVLVIDRDDLAPNDKWVAALRSAGAQVEHVRLPGYVEMVLDPHRAVVPRTIVEAVIDFAAAGAASPGPGVPAPTVAAPSVAAPTVEAAARAEMPIGGGSVTEELVWIDAALVGICTRPRAGGGRGVILLNAGAVPRVGPNRLHVPIARRLAARGALVLRLDLSGIGDSPARPGAQDNVVYSDHALADVAAAVAWVRAQGGRDVAVVGLCSGAYHAFKAAVAGSSVDTVVAINPLTFFYEPGMPLDFAEFKVTEDAQRYAQSVRSSGSWKKVVTGKVDLRRVARVVAARARSVAEHRVRDVLRRLRVPLAKDLGSELYALGRAHVAMRFVFAGDDPGHALLAEQGGSAVTRLASHGALTTEVIPNADHTFTPRWSHPLLEAAIARAIGMAGA